LKKSSANLIALGQRELRAMGEKCDPSCFVWYGCANSKPDGECVGFVLLNGETKRHLHKLLSEDDGKYVANCMRMLQNGSQSEDKESLVKEVLRYIPHQEPETRATGFMAMLEAALPSNPTATAEPEPETRETSGFFRMLEAASGKGSNEREAIPNTVRMTGMLRMVDESQFPQFCDPEKCPKDFARHCSANRPENHGKPCIYITPRNR
jgi:hypothetical protein